MTALGDRPSAAVVVSHLRAYRDQAGLTQGQLAGLARVNVRQIRAAERGFIMATRVASLIRIAAVLDCGLADIWPALGAVRERDPKEG